MTDDHAELLQSLRGPVLKGVAIGTAGPEHFHLHGTFLSHSTALNR